MNITLIHDDEVFSLQAFNILSKFTIFINNCRCCCFVTGIQEMYIEVYSKRIQLVVARAELFDGKFYR